MIPDDSFTRPVVGCTGEISEFPFRGESTVVSDSYRRSVEVAGGATMLLLPTQDAGARAAILSRLDGILLVGGMDNRPERYGAAPHPRTEPMRALRAESDLAYLKQARAMGIPIFGICLGLQEVVVAHGGSLIQDLPTQRPDSAIRHHLKIHPWTTQHDVTVEPDSRLAQILGKTRLAVNSSHHQAADRVPDGFRVVARADDGVVEGIEAVEGAYCLAVQWHPEKVAEVADGASRRLFRAFVEAAADFARQRFLAGAVRS